MKVNTKPFTDWMAGLVAVFFVSAGVWATLAPAASQSNKKAPDIVFDMKCVSIDKDGNQRTTLNRSKILDFTISSENGEVVFTLFFSEDKSAYDLVRVEKNTICSVSQHVEVK